MKTCYIDGVIISALEVAIEFKKSEVLSKDWDSNRRMFIISYPQGTKSSELPNCKVVGEDREFNFEGVLTLHEPHTVNGLRFHLRHGGSSYIWSSFIIMTHSKIIYKETKVGGWVELPAVEVPNIKSEIINTVNTSSSLFYLEEGGEFKISNIQALDLDRPKLPITTFDDVTPYGVYPKLYVTESEIIASFIRTCKKEFPEIEFFPQSSQRKNLGKESIFYKAGISQDRSPKFNSNINVRAEHGSIIQTTIPVELHYQTSDISQYIHRRDSYLFSDFLMRIHDFEVVKQKGYRDFYGTDTEVFNYGTFWDRASAQDDLLKVDSNDGSGRDVYTLTMLCDLIGLIIEKSEPVYEIQSVITSIYGS